MKKYIFFILVVLSLNAVAQTGGRDFKAIDDYIKGLGPMEGMSTATIDNVVINHFEDKTDKLRAIYAWIAMNITYDVKAARTSNMQKNKPADVLASRKAVGIGFASLFQDMCSSANIRCLTVDGFVKYNTSQIGEKGTEINHSWAVVQLGQSPDTWYYVDPGFGSGYLDADMKTFTKSYSDAYFFTDKASFNLQHFPNNEAWKLGPGPRGKGEFYSLPLIRTTAMEYGIKKLTPDDGTLKTKLNKPVYFTYILGNDRAPITSVSLGMGEKKRYKLKEVDFVYSGGTLSFSYKFDEENSFPVMILVNGKEFVGYTVEVN